MQQPGHHRSISFSSLAFTIDFKISFKAFKAGLGPDYIWEPRPAALDPQVGRAT